MEHWSNVSLNEYDKHTHTHNASPLLEASEISLSSYCLLPISVFNTQLCNKTCVCVFNLILKCYGCLGFLPAGALCQCVKL